MKIIKRFKNAIRSRKLLLESNQSLAEKIAESNNPYFIARLEWNHLFGDIRKAKQQWQWISLRLLLINVVAVVALISMTYQSRLVPYAVKVDQLGNALYGGFLDKEKSISPLEINAFLRQYIINARSVMIDPFAQKRTIDFVYSASLSPTRKLLDSYYRESNPFVTAKQELVEVEIQGVIQKSSRTWQVNWVEKHRALEGQLLSQEAFESLITISHLSVKNQEYLNINPLGIYILHISWALQK